MNKGRGWNFNPGNLDVGPSYHSFSVWMMTVVREMWLTQSAYRVSDATQSTLHILINSILPSAVELGAIADKEMETQRT